MTRFQKDDVPFLVEAFRHPYNLIGLGTAAGFALLSWSVLPLVLATGVDLCLVPVLAGLPAFQHLVLTARAASRREEEQTSSRSETVALLGSLSEAERRRYQSLAALASEIRTNYQGLDRSSRSLVCDLDGKLDSLLNAYVRMRGLLARYDRYFAGVNEKQLRDRLAALGGERCPASVREMRERTKAVLEKRIERHRQAVESRQLVEAQAETVGEVLQFLRDQSYSLTDPRSVTEQLEGLVSAAEITERGVRDIEAVFADDPAWTHAGGSAVRKLLH